MKIDSRTIFGNIGYVIDYKNSRWLLTDFNWETMVYKMRSIDCLGITINVSICDILGCEILEDKWEALKHGKI